MRHFSKFRQFAIDFFDRFKHNAIYIYVCNIIKTILFDSILKLSREKGGKEENETRVKFSLTKLLVTGQQYVEYIRWRAKFDRETGSIREGSLI